MCAVGFQFSLHEIQRLASETLYGGLSDFFQFSLHEIPEGRRRGSEA